MSGGGTTPSGGGASSSGSILAPTGITPGELGVRFALGGRVWRALPDGLYVRVVDSLGVWLFPLGVCPQGVTCSVRRLSPLPPCSSSSFLPLLLLTPSMFLPSFFLSEPLLLPGGWGCLYEGAWRALGSFFFHSRWRPLHGCPPRGMLVRGGDRLLVGDPFGWWLLKGPIGSPVEAVAKSE